MAIEERHTTFKPTKHGFHFPNNFGKIGLCGGMVWAALDRFYGNVSKAISHDTEPPSEGSPLFWELVERQMDSIRRGDLIFKCLKWMQKDNEDHWFHEDSVGKLTQDEEWPAIKNLILGGYPVSIVLVTTRMDKIQQLLTDIAGFFEFIPIAGDITAVPFNFIADVLSLWKSQKNHQVLATGFRLDNSNGKLTINIYDPNYPNDDSVTISITLGQDDHKLSASHSKGDNLRGFFLWAYDWRQVVVTEEELKAREEEDDLNLCMLLD